MDETEAELETVKTILFILGEFHAKYFEHITAPAPHVFPI